ncbi:DUF177 domain-containing protein [Pollutibacter soli]|uniref:YceD family protein n=1 Tax=Pollutibacter soli TaxID=3034157 RepID=UPI0030134568
MAGRREYEIAFVGLKPGVHEFNYTIDDKFFADFNFPQQEFSNCHANVKLLLDRQTSFLMLKFEVGGTCDVTCDRCGNPLTVQLWDDFSMLVKMVDNPDELNAQDEDPDVFYISRTESHIDVAGWIYEFINLSVPVHRMCDDKDIDETKCNVEVLKMLRGMNDESKENQNPIWKGLDKFRNI